MDTDEDFLAAVEADNANAPIEQPEAEAPAPEEGKPEGGDRPRDEHGRFAPKVEAQQPVAEQPAAPEPPAAPPPPPAPEQPNQGFVPITAILDEREKRQAAEAELARLRAASPPPPPMPVPDRYEDPEGFEAYQAAQIDNARYQDRLYFSTQLAEVKHGKEAVEAAVQWGFQRCESDPLFNAKVKSSPDPIGLVIAEHQRDQIASEVSPSDLAAFRAWKAAQEQLQQQAGQPPPPPNPSPQIPSPSLAAAPAAGDIRQQPIQSDEEIFAELMPKR